MGVVNSKADNLKRKTYSLAIMTGHNNGVNAMALSDDNNMLATASDDKTVRLWRAKFDGYDFFSVLVGHEDYVNCVLIEDIFVVSGSADRTIRKWNIDTSDCLQVFRGHKSLITRIICTGDFLFSSSYDRTARCWDFESGECVRVFLGHKRGVYPMTFIAAEETDDCDDNCCNRQQDDSQNNKDRLVTGSADYTAIVWSFETGRPIHIFKEHSGAITCMATDSQGKILVTGSTDHTIRTWNIDKGERVRVFVGHQSSITCITVINKIVYSGSADHTCRSWVLDFGDLARVFRGHQHTVSCIKYQDGIVYTGSGDGSVMCFDSKSGSLIRAFKGHTAAINAIQILDGRVLSISHDSTVRLWDATALPTNEVNHSQGEKTTVDISSTDNNTLGGKKTAHRMESDRFTPYIPYCNGHSTNTDSTQLPHNIDGDGENYAIDYNFYFSNTMVN